VEQIAGITVLAAESKGQQDGGRNRGHLLNKNRGHKLRHKTNGTTSRRQLRCTSTVQRAL